MAAILFGNAPVASVTRSARSRVTVVASNNVHSLLRGVRTSVHMILPVDIRGGRGTAGVVVFIIRMVIRSA